MHQPPARSRSPAAAARSWSPRTLAARVLPSPRPALPAIAAPRPHRGRARTPGHHRLRRRFGADLELGAVCTALMMSAAARPELGADLELGAVSATSPPIAAAVDLAGVLLVELGDRRADVTRPRRGPSSARSAPRRRRSPPRFRPLIRHCSLSVRTRTVRWPPAARRARSPPQRGAAYPRAPARPRAAYGLAGSAAAWTSGQPVLAPPVPTSSALAPPVATSTRSN